MTRFLPIDRPLVYGDIVAYQPDGENGDRNFCLRADGMHAHLIELATASGRFTTDADEVFALPIEDLRLVVEE